MKYVILMLLVFLLCAATACAQEEAIKSAVSAAGVVNPSVSVSGTDVMVSYSQPVSAFADFDAELGKVADILKAVSWSLPSATSVSIEQHFDDGQIMVVIGEPADGVAFLGGQMTAEEFLGRLEFNELTRGPLVMEGICEPNKGESCQTAPECACYPNELCQLGQNANAKGCVVQQVPTNAHLVGAEYACDDGYVWNAGLTDCVAGVICPPNAFEFLGQCECLAGYAWDSGRANCIAVGSGENINASPKTGTTPTYPAKPAHKDFLDEIGDALGIDKTLLVIGGAGFLVLIIVIVVAIKLMGRKKRLKQV